LWVYEPDLAVAMTDTRENSIYLPGVHVPESVRISNSMRDVVQGCPVVVIAVPSNFFRAVAEQLVPRLTRKQSSSAPRRASRTPR